MPAKKISKNQFTLPRSAPDSVRARMKKLGITKKEVDQAIQWARRRKSKKFCSPQ